MSREELELQDVQRQMEEQLVEQYTQVDATMLPDCFDAQHLHLNLQS